MALTNSLVGVGMPAKLSERVGYPGSTAITAAGSASTDATVLATQTKVVNGTFTGADGIRLPTNMPLNEWYVVFNSSGSTGLVYPPTGGALNGGSTDTGLSMTTHKVAQFMRLSTNVVIYNLTA